MNEGSKEYVQEVLLPVSNKRFDKQDARFDGQDNKIDLLANKLAEQDAQFIEIRNDIGEIEG